MSLIDPAKRRRIRLAVRSILYPFVLCLLILGAGGLGYWYLDPTIHSFHDGLWLAFTTAATVGYGDVVPSTQAARAFSVVIVILGLAVLSVTTAAIAAVFISNDEVELDNQLEQDILAEIRSLREEIQAMRADVGVGRNRL